jgi:Leucine-rich repeat (LRR) protein
MKLKRFECFFNDDLTEIKALAGMPLEFLQCSSNGVSDLSPIAGAPLRELWSGGTPLRSLEPVRGMPLEVLWCNKTKVVDLSPLAGSPLKHLRCQDTQLTSLEPLASCPLETMECHRTEIRSVAPLRGMSTLQVLNIHSTRVDDLTPLLECKNLKIPWCSIVAERDKPVLSKMTWLTHLNDNSLADFRFRTP